MDQYGFILPVTRKCDPLNKNLTDQTLHYISKNRKDTIAMQQQQQQRQQLKACEAFLNFEGTLQTRATQKQYLWLIQRYAAYRKTLDLDQLIDEDSKNHKLGVARIREFLLSLRTAKLSRGTLNNYKAAIKHFYEMNDISLNWRKINRFAGMEDANAGVKDKDRAYTHEEIQKMLYRSNEKVKAILMLLASSGVRVGAIQSMYLKHLKKFEIENDGIKTYQILVYAGHEDEYITFCTPEATTAIDSYLLCRTRAGEKLNDQSPLFRTDFYADDLFKVRNNVRPMKTEAVSKAIMVALRSRLLLDTNTNRIRQT